MRGVAESFPSTRSTVPREMGVGKLKPMRRFSHSFDAPFFFLMPQQHLKYLMELTQLLLMLIVLIHKGQSTFISRHIGSHRKLVLTGMSVRQESPSAERNKLPIWDTLQSKVLPQMTMDRPLQVLEVAAGAGVHTQLFAEKLLELKIPFRWTPTDPDATSLASIAAYVHDKDSDERLRNFVAEPIKLTLNEHGIAEEETRSILEVSTYDVIIAINLIHISPWSATLGLMRLAGKHLKDGGKLFLYGPYRIDGACVESNL
ncbi:hypothetical protein MPSEU_000994000 [Mayamaea pseudoterrestris]|nr:hypothetical protein MPSEU_000994000 [Mayamaea pseudoterrestris]